ncbi:hypothetical protein QTP81_12220 [Alteromonas sp. ASW11-36]|uniref:Solute-binding protein family 3/N-terminal domain-containing protein n=1 Tax=Alteromonas arenosi TaxID=3055817 RepID=A0ABT7T0M3_9ALTE|nr:hypothetical protein [Alteromonas sp. ASW11-36]MDM7861362.1 hypothetical protein [Alteromonas sp. ASW11-36]
MKAIGKFLCSCTVGAGVLLAPLHSYADSLKLVTTEWETFTDLGAHSERINTIVAEAMQRAGHSATIAIEREAFAASGLNSGKFDGRIDFIDLTEQSDRFVYSERYIPLYLHLVSKSPDIERVRSFSQIRNARVAVENRYAFTPELRLVREINWSRNSTSFDTIYNIADDRSNYLLTDSLYFAEFNRLLIDIDQELLHRSAQSLFTTGLHLTLNRQVENAETILQDFDNAIAAMLIEGRLNELLGLAWIKADTDDDGAQELISSRNTHHLNTILNGSLEDATNSAYTWNSSRTSPTQFIVDGERFADWDAARQYLISNGQQNSHSERKSHLDPNSYEEILRAW